jgi:hypothetical protein
MASFKENPPNSAAVREYAARFFKRLSWGSVFASVFVILAVQVTFSLLGMAIGLGVIDPSAGRNVFAGITTGAAAWWTITFVISLFFGGWFAGRLSGIPSRLSGALHGLISWSLASVVTVYFVTTTLGALIGGSFGVVRNAMAVTGQIMVVPPSVVPIAVNASEEAARAVARMRQEAMQYLRPGESQAAGDEIEGALRRVLQNPDQVREQDRESLVSVLVARTNLDRRQAGARVDSWISMYSGVLTQAASPVPMVAQRTQQYMDDVSAAASTASLWAFFMMLLGGIAALLGGALGAPFDEGTRGYMAERPAGVERGMEEEPREILTR